MIIAGYSCAVLVGLLLGLLGGGGSILAVPVFFYLFGLSATEATTYSLFTVGASCIAGSVRYMEARMISYMAVLFFGIPSVVIGFVTRRFLVPRLPDEINMGSISLSKDTLILTLFATLMLLAARVMIKGRDYLDSEEIPSSMVNKPLTVIFGSITGFLTSLVGAGGGFIIVPMLVKLFRLPVRKAIGTSVALIMLNSLISFSGDVSANVKVDWLFLMKFTGLSLIGIFLGIYISGKIDGGKLKPLFGWFVLAMGAFILIKETLLN